MEYRNPLFSFGVTVDGVDYQGGALPSQFRLSECSEGALPEGVTCALRFENHSGKAVRLERIFWDFRESDVRADGAFRSDRCYIEGWSMPTPSGVRKYDQCDFVYNPDYLRYAIGEPEEYVAGKPGRYRSENVVMLQETAKDGKATAILLAGFVTSHHQYGRFIVKKQPDGVAVRAISAADGRLVEDGEAVESETLMLSCGDDAEKLLRDYAARWGRNMCAVVGRKSPLGWCSWYYYFDKVTEADIVENVDYLAAHRREFPVDVIQIDDGYQHDCGEWLKTNDKFPRGLAWLAKYISERQMTPGLWLAPFLVSENCALWHEHQEWLIHDSQGRVLQDMDWRTGKCAILDSTHPGARQWLRDLFRQVRQLGFKYIKIDFLACASAVRQGVLHDPKATRLDNLRLGLQAIREGMGEDGQILTCTAPTAAVVGLADYNRIATDITPFWNRPGDFDEAPNVPNVCRNVINHTYMHRRLFINDPDTIIVREDNTELTRNECAFWRDAVRLAGGSLLLSDRMSTLTGERAQWLEELVRHYDENDVWPVDRMENYPPEEWRGVNRLTGRPVSGHFDYQQRLSEVSLDGAAAQ